MTQAFADACDRIMAICRAETWIVQAPNDPPGAAIQFPFAALFPGTGTSKRAGSMRTDVHQIRLEIHWAFRDLPRATGDAKDHLEALLDALWTDPTLNSTASTIVNEISYSFGPLLWGAVETMGYVVTIPVKIQPSQTES